VRLSALWAFQMGRLATSYDWINGHFSGHGIAAMSPLTLAMLELQEADRSPNVTADKTTHILHNSKSSNGERSCSNPFVVTCV